MRFSNYLCFFLWILCSLIIIIKIFCCTLYVLKVLSRFYFIHIFTCQLKCRIISISPTIPYRHHVLFVLLINRFWSLVKHYDAFIKRGTRLIFSIIFESIFGHTRLNIQWLLRKMVIKFISMNNRWSLAPKLLPCVIFKLSLITRFI